MPGLIVAIVMKKIKNNMKVNLYEKSFITCFKKFYGAPSLYTILALLPSYLESKDSSLIYMIDSQCLL